VWGLALLNSPDERIIAGVCGPSPAEIALRAARAQASDPQIRDLPPAFVPAAAQPQAAPTVQPAKPPPVDAGPAAPRPTPKSGPARVQLFAGPERAAAQQFIDALSPRLLALAGGRRPEIVEATSSGRPVYRVQIAGFASPADAARFCAVAKASGQDCFVFSPPRR
jgi:cell division septation protein DedD